MTIENYLDMHQTILVHIDMIILSLSHVCKVYKIGTDFCAALNVNFHFYRFRDV